MFTGRAYKPAVPPDLMQKHPLYPNSQPITKRSRVYYSPECASSPRHILPIEFSKKTESLWPQILPNLRYYFSIPVYKSQGEGHTLKKNCKKISVILLKNSIRKNPLSLNNIPLLQTNMSN